jgi:hypothetical protein
MLPVNHLGSDSPLYFTLLEQPCAHDLACINSPVVTLALWFRAQSRCPQTNHRPCASVETRTCTNSSTECCSAKCSPSARQSLREGIQVRQSARQFQLHPDRQLTNRAAHRRANLRGKLNSLPRELAASLLSACVVVESLHTVHIAPSLDDNYSFLSGFQMQNSTEGVHFGSVTLWRASSWTAGQVRSTLVTST